MILISTMKGMTILQRCTDLRKYIFRFLKATCAGHALEVVGGVVGKIFDAELLSNKKYHKISVVTEDWSNTMKQFV